MQHCRRRRQLGQGLVVGGGTNGVRSTELRRSRISWSVSHSLASPGGGRILSGSLLWSFTQSWTEFILEYLKRCSQLSGTWKSSTPVWLGMVVNQLSNTIWNYGETFPVLRFKMRATVLACCSEKPRNCPRRERGCHLWIFFPSCNLGSKT